MLLENVGGVAHVAVDWLGGNLYFTSAKGTVALYSQRVTVEGL